MSKERAPQAIALVIFSVILVQLLGRYYSSHFTYGAFNLLFFVGRLALPILISSFVLKLSFSELGLGWPKLSKAWWIFVVFAVFATPLIISSVLLDNSYLQAYPFYTDSDISKEARLFHFGIFTFSTLLGWEFMHRGFLLFGLSSILHRRAGVAWSLASSLSISITAAFEVLFHFQKPDLEAWGLLAASPLLSWMAFRTKSIWVPALLHLYIEVCFILILVLNH